MSAPKVIRDGKVAVLYSPGFGAGWSTWGSEGFTREQLIFSPELVAAIESKMPKRELVALAEKLFPGKYAGGVSQLRIEWLPVGQSFRIEEYDGSESISFPTGDDWVTA